jgi:small nuclear ribonucleoprotein (snRNP)-like protein
MAAPLRARDPAASRARVAPAVKLNGNRHITGVLRGFDQFMNLVIDETVEQVGPVPSAPRSHASAERARNGYSGSLRPPALWPGPMRSCALPVAVPSAHQCPGCGQQEQTRKRLREGEPAAD